MIISRVPLIVADILLVFITWAKLSTRDTLRHLQGLSLSDIFIRNGMSLFAIRVHV